MSGAAFERVRRPAFSRTGDSVVTSNAIEMGEGPSRIGPLWGGFFAARDGAPEGTIVAIYDQYESDHRGAYRLTLTDEGEGGDTKVAVPEGWYARFVCEGEQPAELIAAWRRIWALTESGELRRTFTTDYEVHASPTRVELLIAVE